MPDESEPHSYTRQNHRQSMDTGRLRWRRGMMMMCGIEKVATVYSCSLWPLDDP